MKKITLRDIAKITGLSISTVSRAINQPDKVSEETRNKVLYVINELDYVSGRTKTVSEAYLEYKNKMAKLPNDTVLSRWGMYTQDERYKDYTASIVNMIKDDMKINTDQAYYMLYYLVSNNIDDYERAKLDMYVDENFEIYRTKRNKVL